MTYSGSPNPDPGIVKRDEETLQRQRDEKAEQDRLEEERRILEQEVPYWQRERDFEQNPPLDNLEFNLGIESKRLVGSRFFDAVEGGVETGMDWLKQQAQDDPNRYSDDMLRLLGGGLQNTAWAISKLPLINEIAKGEDWLAEQARGMSEHLTPFLDPRFAGWGTRIATGILADKGIGKAVKGVKYLGANSIDDLSRFAVSQNPMYAQGAGVLPPPKGVPTQGNLFSSAKLTKYQKDMKNPYMSQPVRMDLAHSMRGTAFRTGEPFDYLKFIDIPTKSMPAQGREYLQYFQAGLTKGGASRAESFSQAQRTLTPSLIDEYNLTNLPKSSFQVHHKAALKAIMGIFDGLDFDSPVFRDVSRVMLKEMPGIGLGNQADNLRGIIGAVGDVGTPHHLVHKYYNKILGKKGNGRAFFTDEVLERMNVDRKFRLDKAKELARIIVNSEEVVDQATKLWELGFSTKKRFKNFDALVNHLSKFDELGYDALSKPKYEAGVFTDIITQIALDPSMVAPVEKSQRGKWILKNMLRDKKLADELREVTAKLKNARKKPTPQGKLEV